MNIGDIIYLAEPVKWRKTPKGDWDEYEYPIGTPVKIRAVGPRGYDITFIETDVDMDECGLIKFTSINPLEKPILEKLIVVNYSNTSELEECLRNGYTIKNISAFGAATYHKSFYGCYVHLIKEK